MATISPNILCVEQIVHHPFLIILKRSVCTDIMTLFYHKCYGESRFSIQKIAVISKTVTAVQHFLRTMREYLDILQK